MKNEIDEIYFKVDIYFKNNSFTQEPMIFKTANTADEFARKKANEPIVVCCKLFQYINNQKRLLSTIYRKEKKSKNF
jgi:hypothetical protein